MDAFYWIIALMLVGMGGFTGYSNWKTYFKAREVREQFLKTHSDAQVIKNGRVRLWIYIAMCIFCIAIGIMIFVMPVNAMAASTKLAQGVVYFGIAIFAVAMIGEALMDDQIIVSEDVMVFEDQIIRFKNIRSITIGKGWFKSSYLVLSQGKELPIDKKTAQRIETLWSEWKKNRKQSFKTRKERRAAARKEREAK